MHYYQFNIGDYASHTKGLSLLEDLAYRRLIDEYYLSEKPLNGSSTEIAKIIGFVEHVDAVDYVLKRFFQEDDGKWVHNRIENDLNGFKKRQKSAKKAGEASAKSRANSTTKNGTSKTVERKSNGRSESVDDPLRVRSNPLNQPITKNHKPITKNQLRAGGSAALRNPNPSHTLGQKFAMSEDWQPSEFFTEFGQARGLRFDQLTETSVSQAVASFRTHFAEETEFLSQAGWENKLVSWIKRDYQKTKIINSNDHAEGLTQEQKNEIAKQFVRED